MFNIWKVLSLAYFSFFFVFIKIFINKIKHRNVDFNHYFNKIIKLKLNINFNNDGK